MTTKERLHKLVDELSEAEADDALRYVASRREDEARDSFARWLESRPEDDEPLTAEDEQAIAEGRADRAAGRTVSHEEMLGKSLASRGSDPVLRLLDNAPEEDEDISAEEEVAVQEARDELAAGAPTIPLEQVMRELGDA
jgi:hypothetical protein